jgi:hypothetical protein
VWGGGVSEPLRVFLLDALPVDKNQFEALTPPELFPPVGKLKYMLSNLRLSLVRPILMLAKEFFYFSFGKYLVNKVMP